MKIELLIGDSKRQKNIAVPEAHRHFQRGSVAMIGPASSGPTMEVSRWLIMPSIDRALIGYSATSPKLSEPAFSNFLRTSSSDDMPAKLMAKLMKGTLVGASHLLELCSQVSFPMGNTK